MSTKRSGFESKGYFFFIMFACKKFHLKLWMVRKRNTIGWNCVGHLDNVWGAEGSLILHWKGSQIMKSLPAPVWHWPLRIYTCINAQDVLILSREIIQFRHYCGGDEARNWFNVCRVHLCLINLFISHASLSTGTRPIFTSIGVMCIVGLIICET